MITHSYTGKLIAIEGIDGSGKSTQTAFLVKRLRSAGYRVVALDFPQYGKKSAGLVEEYLSGKYGSAKEVSPYQASIFYVVDRYDMNFQIREWLEQGVIIVTDRYVGSNIGHQGGKTSSLRDRKKFFRWLYELEYEIFGIQKPIGSFILQVSPQIAKSLCENKERRKIKKEDIHEEDIEHLINAERAYLDAVDTFPEDFTIIECLSEGKLLSRKAIHDKIWKEVEKLL